MVDVTGSNTTASSSGDRDRRAATSRITGFAKRYGEAHCSLARHAAFPLVLTPNLLYQIWANFVPETPWIAVSHILLSRLCRSVGYELYEMEIAVRNQLLSQLKEQHGQQRLNDLAELLQDYVVQQLTDDDPNTQELAQAQEWTALAYTKPGQLARELAEALSAQATKTDLSEVFRLTSLTEILAEPLIEAGFEPLLIYGNGLKNHARGDQEGAIAEFEQLPGGWQWAQTAGVNLVLPKPIKAVLEKQTTAQINESPKLYALLIGIDYYKPNLLYRSLKGCVRDVNLVEGYLKRTFILPTDNLWKLVSPNPEDPELASVRSVQPQQLPTYENIVTAFHEITEAAQPGELVYIHYSGHGGRATTIYPELAGKGQEDEGLVPMDLGDLDGRYLRDVEFATLLKRMTDKGLLVTVILDSCHAGGATRGDCEIRGSSEVDTAARSQDSLVAPRNELIQNYQVPQSRNYVLLAACRPTEYAYEYAVNGKERHGALTYWMIDTLTSSTSALTYKALHDRVNAKIQSKFPAQFPMLMGEGDRFVFGSDRLSMQYTVAVMKVADQQVTLNTGLAQGLSSGTRFAIYPLNFTVFADKQKQLAVVEVTEVQASVAFAQVLTAEAGGIDVKGAIEQGAPAVMISAPVDLVRRVRLFDQKQAGSTENELPPNWVDHQTAALEPVRQALKDNGWVVEVQEGEEAHYQVAIDRDGAYEICIGMPIKNLGSPLKVEAPDSPAAVVNRLIHLAKYQTVQALDNVASELADALEFELLDKDKQPFASTNVAIKQGEVVHLRVKNASDQALNVAVLDLEPTWAISQIPLEGMNEIFYQLGAKQEKIRRLRPSLPSGENYQQAKETLKLFATRGLADFRWLNLSPLDEEIDRKGNLAADLAQKLEGVTRGEAEAQRVNPLNALLATVGADLENAPTVTRPMIWDHDPDAEWVTKQIQLTIER